MNFWKIFAVTTVLAAGCTRPKPHSAKKYPSEHCASFAECRSEFLHGVQIRRERARPPEVSVVAADPVRNGDLSIATVHFPAREKRNLVVILSGVHGIEGFAGSAVQRHFLGRVLPKLERDDRTGYLLVHGLNPWGFAHRRRVTENNVDLNRNFLTDGKEFAQRQENPAFSSLAVPHQTASSGLFSSFQFYLGSLKLVLFQGMAVARQTFLGGQSTYDSGLFYAGTAWEPQVGFMRESVVPVMLEYERVMVIDLHTGYGAPGLNLFPDPPSTQREREHVEKTFAGREILFPESDGFYEARGSVVGFLREQLPQEKIFVPMTFEFGNMDTGTVVGSLRSLRILAAENQAFHKGTASKSDHESIRRDFEEMFFPSDPAWWRMILAQSNRVFLDAIPRFVALGD